MALQPTGKNAPSAGVDEAGRGCLAGPVFAAAVILPPGFFHPLLGDSKQMNAKCRALLRQVIESEALGWGVAFCDHREIDEMNILNATLLAMHRALDCLTQKPAEILVDGNRFKAYGDIPHRCIVGGDARMAPIAAASVLAKTHRDDFMMRLHAQYPQYGWNSNKAYATLSHRRAIIRHGRSPYHRKTFAVQVQEKLAF